MRLIRSLDTMISRVPPLLAVVVVAAVQVAAVLGLRHGQQWPGRLWLSLCLVAVEVALLYAVMDAVAGRAAAFVAGLVFAVAPVVLAKHYFVVGGPSVDYKTVYRHDILPTEYGFTHASAIIAACLFLASAWVALARTRLPLWVAMGASAAAASAAVLVYPQAWVGLAAPVLAALLTRNKLPIAAAVGTAAIGLIAVALFRHIPHVAFGWHRMGITLAGVREFTWSRRVLEYLPLAGLIGLARRSLQAAAFLGVLFLTLVILPLAQTRT